MARFLWLMFACAVFVNAGCQNTCNRQPLFGRNDPPPPKQVYVSPPAPMPLAPAPTGGLPPGAVLTPPPGATIIQPGQPPSISKSPTDKIETQWQPAEGRESPPEIKRDVTPRIQLYAPEPIEKEKPVPTDEPPELRKTGGRGTFPPIGQFADVKANVYAGLRPPLDGLDWLQTNEIQTIVHIHLAGADDSADRKQVEKRNLRYVPFEVSPQTLTKEKADEFVKLIRDHSARGVFVYDEDGSLAGSMWYLFLRYGEVLDDDPAQVRALPLGLQTRRDGQYRDMWLAVQKVLSENSR